MFKKKQSFKGESQHMETIIGSETTIEGKIKLQGNIRIDGKVFGEIECDGDIIIGEEGQVENSINGKTIIIAGSVNGSLISTEKLHIQSTGKFSGTGQINSIVIDEGGSYQGESKMNNIAAEKNSPPLNSTEE